MKKIYIIISIIAIIIIIVQSSGFTYNQEQKYFESGVPNSQMETIAKAFTYTGADIKESNLNCWAKISDDFMDMQYMEQLSEQIFKKHIYNTNQYECFKSDEDSFRQVMFTLNVDEDIILVFALQTIKHESDSETYMLVDVVQNNSYNYIIDIENKILDLYQAFDIQPESTACIIGALQAKADDEQIDQIYRKVFNNLKIENVDAVESGGAFSVTGYTPLIEDSIVLGDHKVNINMACRYNSFEDKTYILLATPLICVEY
ncbi:MAG: YwmB family TATA-box binding protein [Clostridia bacterium]|nr:YwmB family TATA-box binding protein [Clostridia bacterium]